MIEWGAFAIVAVAALVGASVLVTLTALGIRLVDAAEHRRTTGRGTGSWHRAGAVTAFGTCAIVVAYGIFLIVPTLH